MAIQMRRGSFTDFDPSKMLPGEWAVMLSGDDTSDGYAVYICYQAGVVRRVVTSDELSALSDNIYEEVSAQMEDVYNYTAVMQAASAARAAAEEAQAAIEAIGDISELAVPLMSSTTRGGAKLGSGLLIEDGALCVDASTIDVPIATTSHPGAVMPDGTTITVDNDGTIHGTGSAALPTMSASVKGGAKLGAGLSVADDTLSLAGESYTSAEKNKLAGIEAGANNYSLPTMSANTKGGAKLGAGLSVADDTLSLSGESYTSSEKTKLAGIEANANNYTLPTMDATTKGGAKVGSGLTVNGDVLSLDSHTHAASDVTSGEIPIAHGGTGASTAAGARSNLSVLEYSSGVFNVGGTSAYLLFKTTAIASFAPPTGVSACMVLDTSDNGLYWYTS